MTDAYAGRPLRVLLVEDNPADAELVLRQLKRGGFAVDSLLVDNEPRLRQALSDGRWDVVLCDWVMPGFSGLDALALVRSMNSDVPFIILSGTVGEEVAVEAMRAGAHDYVLKDRSHRLVPVIERELREAETRREGARLRDRLQQAAKEESIGRLAGGVAHDFNNILTAIIGYAELGARQVAQGSSLERCLHRIDAAARRGAGLTRQLLAFARHQPFEPRPVSLKEVLERSLDMLPVLLGPDVHIDATLLAERPARVDPHQVDQVLMNLAVNARDAMPTGGRLTLAIHDEGPGPHGDGSWVRMEVGDTGSGMSEEVIARLFEPFFTTKPVGKGTGLGLATIKAIIERHHGSIAVRSIPGKGSTFTVWWPAADAVEQPSRAYRTPMPLGSATGTVLVVEVDPLVRELGREVLESFGHTVLTAGDAAAALALADAQGPVDVLVTDLVLPDGSGAELAADLHRRTQRTVVLYTTGFASDRPDDESAFLPKPFSPAELSRRVADAVARARR
ncbi:hypothetical protein LBMAG53_16790 [Planctomycetota bacterium]|nr:hypothetical protein LBMAG53_16790 [Planctomycetota bacterium]